MTAFTGELDQNSGEIRFKLFIVISIENIRNMNSFKYLLMIDLDELIVPYKQDTLAELIAGDLIMMVVTVMMVMMVMMIMTMMMIMMIMVMIVMMGMIIFSMEMRNISFPDLSSKTMVQAGKSLPPSQVIFEYLNKYGNIVIEYLKNMAIL